MQWNVLSNTIMQKRFKEPIVLTGWPCELRYFWKYQHIWFQEFKFHEQVLVSVKYRLERSKTVWKKQNNFEKNSTDPLIITVHVRRTDYIEWMDRVDGDVLDTPYFAAAFKHYEKR